MAQGVFDHFGIKTTTKLIDFSGGLILVVAVLLTATMLYSARNIDQSRLVTFHNSSVRRPRGGLAAPTRHICFYWCCSIRFIRSLVLMDRPIHPRNGEGEP